MWRSLHIVYSLRTHVLSSEDRVFITDAFGEPIKVRTVAAMEIFAAKTNALISRAAARDLYDFCNMADMELFSGEGDIFRKCIIFYATIFSDFFYPISMNTVSCILVEFVEMINF